MFMVSKKFRILLGIGIILLIGSTGGFFAWQNGLFSRDDGPVVKEGMPPLPKGYKDLNEDPAVVAGIPESTQEQYRKGFEELLATIQEHPDSFGAWFNLGSVKHFFGDYRGAEASWLYATDISPLQARSLMNLGDLYWNVFKDYERAEWAYLTALERQDASIDRIRAYRDLASLYRFSYTQKKSLAISVLRAGIESLDDNTELLALAGMWSWEDGMLAEAAGFYEQFLAKNPSHEQARKDLNQIRAQMKK